MLFDILSAHFCLAMREGFTLEQGISAIELMFAIDYLLVSKHLLTPVLGVNALELEVLKFP
jgi:hypothetical protein